MKLLIKPLNDSVKSLYHDSVSQESNTNRSIRGDAGFDVYFPKDLAIKANETVIVDLEIQCEGLSDSDSRNVSYSLEPRSSIAKTPLRMSNGRGIIDAGYRGNLKVPIDNRSDNNYQIKKGQRLFQICGRYLEPIYAELAESLSETERGNNGFGSTGV
jgi:dUTP pyrophosphatase